jgi:hypothetical protein
MSARQAAFSTFLRPAAATSTCKKKLILPFSPDSVVTFQVAMDLQLALYA